MDGYESASRQLLLTLLAAAEKLGNRRVADSLLVDATRWLRAYPYDIVIWEAREQLRVAFPPLH
jgi:hypothetical protein